MFPSSMSKTIIDAARNPPSFVNSGLHGYVKGFLKLTLEQQNVNRTPDNAENHVVGGFGKQRGIFQPVQFCPTREGRKGAASAVHAKYR